MKITALVLSAALLVACGVSSPIPPADGQTVVDTLNWTNPATRTDGSPLTNLATIRIQWGTSPSGPFNLGGSNPVSDTSNPLVRSIY